MRLGCEAGQWPLPQACKRVVRSARQWRSTRPGCATESQSLLISQVIEAINPILRGWVHYFRGHTSAADRGGAGYANVVAIRCRLTPSPRRDTSAPRKTCNQFCAMMVPRYEAVNMASRMAVFSTKVIPRIRRFMMNDPRPVIAIGHVRLLVGNVAKTTDFFVKLGIRTIVEQADFAVLEWRGGTHLAAVRTWEEPEGGSVPFDIMVDDIDALPHVRIKGHGMEVTDISRGRIHDHFEVQTPDRRALTISSSHAGDRVV